MAAVTFDKELLQSCVKAEIEALHYKDLTKSSNRAGLLPFPLIAAAWPPSHTYTTTTEDPTLTPGERQHIIISAKQESPTLTPAPNETFCNSHILLITLV